jgi:hypothetical protein
MDQISLLFAAMLVSVSQMAAHSSVPLAGAPPPTVAVQAAKKQPLSPSLVVVKSEHCGANYGQQDANGNLNYFCH